MQRTDGCLSYFSYVVMACSCSCDIRCGGIFIEFQFRDGTQLFLLWWQVLMGVYCVSVMSWWLPSVLAVISGVDGRLLCFSYVMMACGYSFCSIRCWWTYIVFQLRRDGMRLFLLWYQVLMDNATDECHKTFAGLVPKLGTKEIVDQDIFTVRTEG